MKKLNLVFVVVILMVIAGCTKSPTEPATVFSPTTNTSVGETVTVVSTEVVTAVGTATAISTEVVTVAVNTATATMTSTIIVVLSSPTFTSTPLTSTIVFEITGDVDGLFNLKYGTNNGNGIVLFYNNAKPATAATAFNPGTKTWTSLPITQVAGSPSAVYYSGDVALGQVLTVVLKRTCNGITDPNWHTTVSADGTGSVPLGHFGGTIGQ